MRSLNSSLLIAALGLMCVTGTTRAEVKDPLPDSLSLGGVTLYATIDVGYAYQSHGVPLSGDYVGGLEYQAFTTTRNFAGSQSTFAESGLEQSKVGIRVSEPIVDDFTLIARADTGFNPLSGHLTDACKALASNSSKPQGAQTANADSSRCGQAFNGVLWVLFPSSATPVSTLVAGARRPDAWTIRENMCSATVRCISAVCTRTVETTPA